MHTDNLQLFKSNVLSGSVWFFSNTDVDVCYFHARRLRPSSSALPLPFQRDRSAITASPWACRKLKTKLLFLVFSFSFSEALGLRGSTIALLLLPIHERRTNGRRNFRPMIHFGTVYSEGVGLRQNYKWRKVHWNKCVSACRLVLWSRATVLHTLAAPKTAFLSI